MAKRLGSVLTNTEGSAKQLFKVTSDGSGFEFKSQAIPEYTITNLTESRSIDCVDTNIDELSNLLGTLITDSQAVFEIGTSIGGLKRVSFLFNDLDPGPYFNCPGTTRTINHNLGSTLIDVRVKVNSTSVDDTSYTLLESYYDAPEPMGTLRYGYYWNRLDANSISVTFFTGVAVGTPTIVEIYDLS